MKKEFDSIELIDRNIAWQENIKENKYTALRDTSSIFVTFDHGVFQRLGFKKGNFFQIEKGDFLVYDENLVSELSI